jgi:hypothetical protein
MQTALEPVTLQIDGVTPPSVNGFLRAHWTRYDRAKAKWGEMCLDALTRAETPRGEWAGVLAEGMVTFPTRIKRDQGNHRFMLEKALGDALVSYGALPDDDWARYEFGNLQSRYERGVSRVEVMLWPR